jgi:thiol-disulfide isomerase/thioredoxin
MDNEPTSTEPEEAGATAPAPSTIDVSAREQQKRQSGTARGLLIAIGVGIVAVFAMQVFTLLSAGNTDDQVAALEAQVDQVAVDVSAVRRSMVDVDRKVEELAAEAPIAAAGSGASAAVAPSTPAGWLPPFEQGQPDAALGIALGDVTGPEYYSEADLTVDPADGTTRAWLVWAHWCPHCQRELPALSEWYEANAASYPNVELVSVTTSIDPGRGNPLEPYLDELALPFPAIVDADLALAEQFGASAFPFWVFTGPDGTTLLRVAGFLEIAQLEEIFNQLAALPA